MIRTPTLALVLSLTLSAGTAQAQYAAADPVIARIEADGYTVTDVRRTLLGRVLIEATRDTTQREVVVNRRTGDVLQDRTYPGAAPEARDKEGRGSRAPAAPGDTGHGPGAPGNAGAGGAAAPGGGGPGGGSGGGGGSN